MPGVDVILERSDNPNRKTLFSIIGVYKGSRLVNMDSQVPNQAVFEALSMGAIGEIGKVEKIKREVTYHQSRFDLYFEKGQEKAFLEVKGVTFEQDGIAMFPDAPTARGTRHIYEMIQAVKDGYIGHLFFLIQMKGVRYFTPYQQMDKEFAEALFQAWKNGVKILAYDSVVRPDEIIVGNPVEIRL